MIREELYIITDNGREALDLTSPSGITLKWVSNLFNDLSKLACSHSYTFKLPVTANNRRLLNMADDIRCDSDSFKKVVRAEFFINGVCLCPNAKLYLNEVGNSFRCVMIWRVLESFETLKSNSAKLNVLPSLGSITWGDTEVYGQVDENSTNLDSVVYPDYDAGVPHTSGNPPRPCVPIYKLITMINDTHGTRFNVGTYISSHFGKNRADYFNDYGYYGRPVYDDYISNGVIPLVNSNINTDAISIFGLTASGNIHLKYRIHKSTQKFLMYIFPPTTSSPGSYALHINIVEGNYTSFNPVNHSRLNATYVAPLTMAIGLQTFDFFSGNDYIKPLYGYQHDTGLTLLYQTEEEYWRAVNRPYHTGTGHRIYSVTERIGLEVGTTMPDSWTSPFTWTYDDTGYSVYHGKIGGKDSGTKLGIIGFKSSHSIKLYGSCIVHISKDAVDARRITVDDYWWICLAKKMADEEFVLEATTEKDTSSYLGFQSIDKPTFNEDTQTYVCAFDFGSTYEARAITIDADDDEKLEGYIFLPYFVDDYYIDVNIDDANGGSTTEKQISLQYGDVYFDNFSIARLEPIIDTINLPSKINVTDSLPDITCFNFMKSLFYMNGAMPRVERDGVTISAMYYNQLRDRVNSGDVIDWSRKLLSADSDLPSSFKFHNTTFARNNYFEMALSRREMTDKEYAQELDRYSDGYGNIIVDDATLDEETTPFTSVFYPPYILNVRYPVLKTGRTCKVWEGDRSMVEDVPPVYGIMSYRLIDPSYEDSTAQRPNSFVYTNAHIRMDVFSPFDSGRIMRKLFGYLQKILANYRLIKEKFLLDELDLRDFDESVPIYLSKYNAYFAVSSLQRNKDGITTAELVKLPREDGSIYDYKETFSYEIIKVGWVEFWDNSESKIFCKATEDSPWVEMLDKTYMYGDDVYAIASAGTKNLVFVGSFSGQYKLKISNNQDSKTIERVKSNIRVLFNDTQWDYNYNMYSIWHDGATIQRLRVEIPIKNDYDTILDTYQEELFCIGTKNNVLNPMTEDAVRYEFNTFNVMHMTLFLCVGNFIEYKRWSGITYVSDISRGRGFNNTSDTDGFDGNSFDIPVSTGALSPSKAGSSINDTYYVIWAVPDTITYELTKYVGSTIVYTESITIPVRVYLDDVRVVSGNTTINYDASANTDHVWKIIGSLVDKEGNVIGRLREKIRYSTTTPAYATAQNNFFGDEHEDDV